MTDQITIIGSPVSPYVRKVLANLDMKGVPFRCIPQVPFVADENFTKLSPLRQIPVMQIGEFTLPDSTAIVQYLEDVYPEPAAYPGDAKNRARVRWFEEYADGHLGKNVTFSLFFQKVVRPRVLKEEPDQAIIDDTIKVHIPNALDYLESELAGTDFLCGEISVADITIAAMMKNAFWAGWTLDDGRWPRFAAYLARMYDHPSLAKVNSLAEAILAASPAEHAAILDRFLAAA